MPLASLNATSASIERRVLRGDDFGCYVRPFRVLTTDELLQSLIQQHRHRLPHPFADPMQRSYAPGVDPGLVQALVIRPVHPFRRHAWGGTTIILVPIQWMMRLRMARRHSNTATSTLATLFTIYCHCNRSHSGPPPVRCSDDGDLKGTLFAAGASLGMPSWGSSERL